ncbi:hypothetical protein EDB92DRAFT_1821948 [Lactarius akahatsu]|uniref:Uncharacterized protein n=1 Tax=Lactarius akahatsu TaxID=416441 RepID=A0AAD4Q7P8_9AGAM|nr:hypothetical protein EDB92DRAFT_1821948 [Lactarius akahatsu]
MFVLWVAGLQGPASGRGRRSMLALCGAGRGAVSGAVADPCDVRDLTRGWCCGLCGAQGDKGDGAEERGWRVRPEAGVELERLELTEKVLRGGEMNDCGARCKGKSGWREATKLGEINQTRPSSAVRGGDQGRKPVGRWRPGGEWNDAAKHEERSNRKDVVKNMESRLSGVSQSNGIRGHGVPRSAGVCKSSSEGNPSAASSHGVSLACVSGTVVVLGFDRGVAMNGGVLRGSTGLSEISLLLGERGLGVVSMDGKGDLRLHIFVNLRTNSSQSSLPNETVSGRLIKLVHLAFQSVTIGPSINPSMAWPSGSRFWVLLAFVEGSGLLGRWVSVWSGYEYRRGLGFANYGVRLRIPTGSQGCELRGRAINTDGVSGFRWSSARVLVLGHGDGSVASLGLSLGLGAFPACRQRQESQTGVAGYSGISGYSGVFLTGRGETAPPVSVVSGFSGYSGFFLASCGENAPPVSVVSGVSGYSGWDNVS